MFGAQHLHHPITRFCAVLLRLYHTPCLPLGYPPHCCPQLPLEHLYVVSIIPVLLRFLPTGGAEVLRTSAQRIIHKHLLSPAFPGVDPLLDPSPYWVVCGDMLVSLKYHCLEDDEHLRIPLSVLHPTQVIVQFHDKATTYLPTRHIVAAGRHDRKVTSTPLPHLVVQKWMR